MRKARNLIGNLITHNMVQGINREYIFEKVMQEINSRYARYYNNKKERVEYVFRNRFESKIIRTELQILRCIKYIHMNPVKAHIADSEGQYEFSSYNHYINKNQFINSKILNSIFNSKKDYLEKLINIQYINLNLEKEKNDLSKFI